MLFLTTDNGNTIIPDNDAEFYGTNIMLVSVKQNMQGNVGKSFKLCTWKICHQTSSIITISNTAFILLTATRDKVYSDHSGDLRCKFYTCLQCHEFVLKSSYPN